MSKKKIYPIIHKKDGGWVVAALVKRKRFPLHFACVVCKDIWESSEGINLSEEWKIGD